MKTEDLIQLGTLAAIGFLAYQKFAKAAPKPNPANQPLQPSYQIPTDFGLKDPNAGWDDDGSGGMTFLQKVIEWIP